MLTTLRKGFINGLSTTWSLGKVIFPVTLIVTVLSYTTVFDTLIHWIAPVMGWLGLPGEAAVPLVFGNLLNLYAGIGAILSMDLTVKSVFILAVMMSFSHNLLIECGVASRVGVKVWVMIVVRLGLALLSAVAIGHLWHGGDAQAVYGFLQAQTSQPHSWLGIVEDGFEKALLGIGQLAIIVIPLMVIIQVLKDLQWMAVFAKWMTPVTRFLGISPKGSTTLASGLILGLTYGAGVMIQAVKDDDLDRRSLYLAFIFLVGCHAVVEDTIIFAPLGISLWPLLCLRLCVAIFMTWLVGMVWRIAVRKTIERKRQTTL
ncbi:putative membrane protein YvoD [Pullulanibacillus camelliae]|uniref:Putative membrane protein YvoD n=1 Tax=Pullulanibacillus camelliae TaxID=1707096 RepID=A0A8J2VPW1_9BACL|nr:nucleoside recognition domain-containing protein [Pullulanibacillus camelliae]GGE36505.1 putative membrane protein YvoD [Pullulanibacillus camelliae]